MIQVSTSTPATSSAVQIPLRWRLLIYFSIWLVAASILATFSDIYLDDDNAELSTRLGVFITAPIEAAMGLDFALLSTCHWATSQVGGFTWIFVLLFTSHALFTFSCAQRISFVASISVLFIALCIGVFYAMRFYHLDTIFGHG